MLSIILLAIGFIGGLFTGIILTCIVSASDNNEDDFS